MIIAKFNTYTIFTKLFSCIKIRIYIELWIELWSLHKYNKFFNIKNLYVYWLIDCFYSIVYLYFVKNITSILLFFFFFLLNTFIQNNIFSRLFFNKDLFHRYNRIHVFNFFLNTHIDVRHYFYWKYYVYIKSTILVRNLIILCIHHL